MLSNFFPFTVHVLLGLLCFAESVHEAVLKSTAALKTDLDEERRKYQGLLRDFSRLEQRYDNLREMSLLTEVQNCAHTCDLNSLALRLNPFSCSHRALKVTGGQTPHRA